MLWKRKKKVFIYTIGASEEGPKESTGCSTGWVRVAVRIRNVVHQDMEKKKEVEAGESKVRVNRGKMLSRGNKIEMVAENCVLNNARQRLRRRSTTRL